MSKKQPEYGKYPIDALEEVTFDSKFGQREKGDKRMVHPQTAEFYRWKGGIIKDDTKKAKDIEVKDPETVKTEDKPKKKRTTKKSK